jgi:hypothetical protein
VARAERPNWFVAAVLALSALCSCSDVDRGPPVGQGGGDGNPGPVVVEFGGAADAGTAGTTSRSAGTFQVSAGSLSTAGDSPLGIAGDTSMGASSGGDTVSGSSFDFGGNSAVAGTFPASGSFATGGL